jgi:hypothetical protein
MRRGNLKIGMAVGLATAAGLASLLSAGVAGAKGASASKPGAPTGLTAVASYTSVELSWTAPASTGSSPIVSYHVKGLPTACNTASTSCDVSGLKPGKKYTVAVQAINATVKGAYSTSVQFEAGVPAPPTNVVATAGNGSAVVKWTIPAQNNANVTEYDVTSSGGQTCSAPTTGLGTSCTVTGLTNGTAYTFTVTTTNPYGTSVPSAPSAAVTPTGPAGVPTNVVASGEVVSGSPGVVVNFSAPASNGGSAITGYTVVVNDQTASTTVNDAAPVGAADVPGTPGTGYTISGLNAGDTYLFSVITVNAKGNSAASAPVGPTAAAPDTVGSSSNGDGSADITWSVPTVTYGTTVTGYEVSTFDLNTYAVSSASVDGGDTTSTTVSGYASGDSVIACVSSENVNGTGDNESCTQFTE